MACGILFSNFGHAQQLDSEISQLVKFLSSKQILVKSKDNFDVPLSYYIGDKAGVAKYFGDMICLPENTCSVVDSIYNSPYAILGRGLPPQQGTDLEKAQAQAQIERTDMQYGADIYDAATWQIALALAAKNGYIDKAYAKQLIDNQTRRIIDSSNRATSKGFQYGYSQSITDPKKAFAFRMIATNFHNKDPFYQGPYQEHLSYDYSPDEIAKNDPDGHDADDFTYVTTWSDWKPITGENAWALLLGPLQAEAILNDGKIEADSAGLHMAINSLYAFSAMQSGVGGFYYAPGGSDGNQGPITRGEISIENNFSVLGGLQVMQKLLANTEQTAEVRKARENIAVMLNGGETVNGYQTLGLLSFFYNGAYNSKLGVFYTHGLARTPKSTVDWEPDNANDPAAQAVDVNTWGISALGPETIDKWYGKGTARKMWEVVREKGGYFNNGQLWGVGYTLQNNSGTNPELIMSAEWTAGAISALNSLISYYKTQGEDVSVLEQDLQSMQQSIKYLRSDNYLNYPFDSATAKEYYVGVPKEAGLAYLYASKRFSIPFGWNANTLASTTSNAWVIMNHMKYNPFQYQGALIGQNYATPKKQNISSGDDNNLANALPVDVNVKFTQDDLGPVIGLSMSYANNSAKPSWVTATTVNSKDGKATQGLSGEGMLPAGAEVISIAYSNNGWYGACQVKPASKICKDEACTTVKTIVARYSTDGQGACDLN